MLVVLACAMTLMVGCRQQSQDIEERGGFALRDASRLQRLLDGG
jgi:hypothetical protein